MASESTWNKMKDLYFNETDMAEIAISAYKLGLDEGMKAESELIWTDKRPDSEGWFWWKLDNDVGVTWVRPLRAFGKRYCAFIPGQGWIPVEEAEGYRWAGPILPPKER